MTTSMKAEKSRPMNGDVEDWSGLRDAKQRRKLQNRLNVRAHRLRQARAARSRHTPILELCAIVRQLHSQHVDLSRLLALTSRPLLNLEHKVSLIHYNVIRACATNAKLVFPSAPWAVAGQKCSWFVQQVPVFPISAIGASIPPDLQPTQLQVAVRHELWIDVLPCPQLRDNVIRWKGRRQALLDDLAGGVCSNRQPGRGERGLIAWMDPWSASGWEVSEGFLQKWGYLLVGCDELLDATNRWRKLRGEEELGFASISAITEATPV